jgi:hypothetical protein
MEDKRKLIVLAAVVAVVLVGVIFFISSNQGAGNAQVDQVESTLKDLQKGNTQGQPPAGTTAPPSDLTPGATREKGVARMAAPGQ